MNIHEMTIEQLRDVKILTVAQGRQFADDILDLQIGIHRQMVELDDKDEWQKLCNRHYDLRKLRREILLSIGNMVIRKKKLSKRLSC